MSRISRCSDSKSSSSRNIIPVVVVESHQHVLEHYHFVLRRRHRHRHRHNVLLPCWSMIHFDAHADLACPGSHIPAKACFQPNMEFQLSSSSKDDSSSNSYNLYELLDSTSSGIAEWILPLVLAANLRNVHWIRPSPPPTTTMILPPQIPLGCHSYHVGVVVVVDSDNRTEIDSFLDLPDTTEATVQVDWKIPYYLDDETTSSFSKQQLHLSQLLNLQVSELSSSYKPCNNNNENAIQKNEDCNDDEQHTNEYALDICLDYFYCFNPFLTELEQMNGQYTRALLQFINKTHFYSSSSGGGDDGGDDDFKDYDCNRYHNLKRFHSLLMEFLEKCIQTKHNEVKSTTTATQPLQLNDDETDMMAFELVFAEFFPSEESISQGKDLLFNLIQILQQEQQHGNQKLLLQLTKEALPNVSMPHHFLDHHDAAKQQQQQQQSNSFLGKKENQITTITKSDCSRSVLEKYPIVQERLQIFRDFLQSTTTTTKEPFLISIARSANDGFTPMELVEELQHEVLKIIHERYNNDNNTDNNNTSSTTSCLQNDGCDEICNTKNDGFFEMNKDKQSIGRSMGSKFHLLFDYGEWEGSTFEDRL